MKLSGMMFPWGSLLLSNIVVVSSFQAINPSKPLSYRPATKLAVVNIDESAQRDIGSFDEWAINCGVQRSEGFQLTTEDGQDFSVMTTQDLPAQSPVLFVPNQMILSSNKAVEEIGRMPEAEKRLVSAKAADHVPEFYLFLKILYEYEMGEQSPYFPWLNSLPRLYSNGASMTPFCFDCLPPLAGNLAMGERIRFIQFFQSLKYVGFLSDYTKTNKDLAKWAFGVVYTRGFKCPDGDFRVVPMGDMFNHGTETEIQINYDDDGNFCAYASRDVPAGSPLRMSYGDPTNPSQIFARYGFLDESSPATFCKIMINRPSKELVDMGYDHSKMLFYKDTGDVSPEVYDVLLYQILASDPQRQQAFYNAHMNGDYDTKQQFHEHFYPETSAALRNHVDTFLNDLEVLSNKGVGVDVSTHPRLPLIMQHNEFVKKTFLTVRSQLYEYA
uniref:SET domain-containing protein n=1 Tax=Helicotheca tamesis TaxID=374047 RepID=A0A7S2MJ56_9STRA|mmetsp:Transcript_16903/g.23177  ORF Transcript_16903/g.23177 Transcript_16903/m.23177 type:complete len:442 (+) Transcript_16903:1-1326(+)|eukprot:CAMPEP_0185730816 /NCGR_PEP_ID=MMETSP1171-20130828/11082_1 /TAXON_ID=374046 /ORGANISM="Helicotheca tamensis, Strain CCMP826" /LENGTH=441 /DNA_ID=CAMNT_0028399951 /DNA_START=51 /DNA_END=1376 /DNA_ORIENTATION=+